MQRFPRTHGAAVSMLAYVAYALAVFGACAAVFIAHMDSIIVKAAATAVSGTAAVYCLRGAWHNVLRAAPPKIYVKPGDARMTALVNKVATLKRPYRPTFWAHSAYGQFLALGMSKVRYNRGYTYTTEVLRCPDGGEVAVREIVPDDAAALPQDAPVLLILHTITGTVSDEVELAKHAYRRGHRPVLLCRRGHFGKPLATPNFNIMGNAEDTHLMVKHVRAKYPRSFLGAAGISAGSGQVVSYIGQQGSFLKRDMAAGQLHPLNGAPTPHLVDAAVSLCPAYAVDSAFMNVTRDSPAIATLLLRQLKAFFVASNKHVFEGAVGYDAAMNSTTLRDFMQHTAGMTGHASYEAFLKTSCPMQHFYTNTVPCLILNAADDPLCVESNIRYDLAGCTDNYALAVTPRGSHVAFREGLLGGGCYMHDAAIDFLDACRTHSMSSARH